MDGKVVKYIMGMIIMIIVKNRIHILITLIINVLPWILTYKIVTNSSINNPLDPEGVLVALFFMEVVMFCIWFCCILYLLILNKKNKVSVVFIGVSNLPYVVFYGYGHVSIINLLLTPFLNFIDKIIKINIPFENILLIFMNILSWILFLFMLHKRKMKNTHAKP